jgi:hypothetical protein
MTTYFIECYWPDVSRTQLAAALGRLGRHPVRCLETILVPADEIVLCVVKGTSVPEIHAAVRHAGLPSERVVECVRVRPGPGPAEAPGSVDEVTDGTTGHANEAHERKGARR